RTGRILPIASQQERDAGDEVLSVAERMPLQRKSLSRLRCKRVGLSTRSEPPAAQLFEARLGQSLSLRRHRVPTGVLVPFAVDRILRLGAGAQVQTGTEHIVVVERHLRDRGPSAGAPIEYPNRFPMELPVVHKRKRGRIQRWGGVAGVGQTHLMPLV